jgi:hypothetical protein
MPTIPTHQWHDTDGGSLSTSDFFGIHILIVHLPGVVLAESRMAQSKIGTGGFQRRAYLGRVS